MNNSVDRGYSEYNSYLYTDNTFIGHPIRNMLNATCPPTWFDDSNNGFSSKSYWFDTTSEILYVCFDACEDEAWWYELSPLEEDKDVCLEKLIILQKLEELIRFGVELSQEYNIESDITVGEI